MKVSFVKAQIITALKEAGFTIKEDMIIAKAEFLGMLMNPLAAKGIRSVGVDPMGLIDFCEFIFSGECSSMSKTDMKEGISFIQFIELMLEMGGQNAARVKDVIDLRKVLFPRFEGLDHRLLQQEVLLQQLVASSSQEYWSQQKFRDELGSGAMMMQVQV